MAATCETDNPMTSAERTTWTPRAWGGGCHLYTNCSG